LLAFNYNTHDGPYLYGSLLEPVSALLFTLGLGYMVATWRDEQSQFLLAWFAMAVVVTGVVSKYDYVSVSRLNFLLPLVTMIAAVAGDRIVESLARFRRDRQAIALNAWPLNLSTANHVYRAGLVALVALSASWNLHRWFIDMPRSVPSTPDALALRIIELPVCQSAARPPLVVDVGVGGAMGPAIDALSNGIVRPQFALYSEPTSWMKTADSRCVIFRDPGSPVAQRLIKQFGSTSPGHSAVDERDVVGRQTEVVFYPSGAG
jgi:hypothetical protein